MGAAATPAGGPPVDSGVNDICWDDMEGPVKGLSTVAFAASPGAAGSSSMRIRCGRAPVPSWQCILAWLPGSLSCLAASGGHSNQRAACLCAGRVFRSMTRLRADAARRSHGPVRSLKPQP